MPRASRLAGTNLITVSVRGAGQAAADFNMAQREIQNVLLRELRDLGTRALAILRDHALEDTGDLKREMRVVPFARAGRPQVTIISPVTRDGYAYTAVTRFGHRKSVIRPVRAHALAVHGPKRESILAWAAFVRGFRPSADWVEQAMPAIDREAALTADRIAQRVGVLMLPGGRAR